MTVENPKHKNTSDAGKTNPAGAVKRYIYMNGFREWVDLTYKGITLDADKRDYDSYPGDWTDKDIFFDWYKQEENTDEGLYQQCKEVLEEVCDEVDDEAAKWEAPPEKLTLSEKADKLFDRLQEMADKLGIREMDENNIMKAAKAFLGDYAENFGQDELPHSWSFTPVRDAEGYEEMLDEALTMREDRFYRILKHAVESDWMSDTTIEENPKQEISIKDLKGWTKKLTKAEKKHLRETAGVRDTYGLKRTLEYTAAEAKKKNGMYCHECYRIGKKLGVI